MKAGSWLRSTSVVREIRQGTHLLYQSGSWLEHHHTGYLNRKFKGGCLLHRQVGHERQERIWEWYRDADTRINHHPQSWRNKGTSSRVQSLVNREGPLGAEIQMLVAALPRGWHWERSAIKMILALRGGKWGARTKSIAKVRSITGAVRWTQLPPGSLPWCPLLAETKREPAVKGAVVWSAADF